MPAPDHQAGQHRAAVVGAAGYTGQELVRFVLDHPCLTLAGVFGSGEGPETSYADRCPAFRGLVDDVVQPATAEAILASGASIALLATPHEASAQLAPALLDAGVHVFDLSAAFRLPSAAAYPVHYGFEHPAPSLLAEAVYGLPEFNRELIASAGEPALIAVPGCYPTAATLPLAPLVRAGLVDAGSVPIINAVSGISGAGRKATGGNQFCEVSLKPYGVLTHRHAPEIETHAGVACSFVPH
ncbi:MAG: N-acetyl-gamma-glutamyl-phosphate reductase, partial [Phycisphaerales bacterium]